VDAAVTPDLLPMLARGRHRNPRRGACFMELASYLAGERWSDAPECTDPSLAALARMVNDVMSDGARPGLAPLVPSVVGTRGLPSTFAGDLALVCVDHAIGVVAATHQRALAVGTLRLLDDPAATASGPLRTRARAALDDVPDARDWAAQFLGRVRPERGYSPAAALLEVAVQALAVACVDAPDARLRAMLAEGIDLAREQLRVGAAPALRPADWLDRVRIAG
jgi:hypothetical protein